jgi:hypothetical protein
VDPPILYLLLILLAVLVLLLLGFCWMRWASTRVLQEAASKLGLAPCDLKTTAGKVPRCAGKIVGVRVSLGAWRAAKRRRRKAQGASPISVNLVGSI